AEAAEALADAEQNRQFLTTLANLGIATHRLDRIRDAARLHRQQLLGTSELYAVIEADDDPERAAVSAVVTPAAGQAALRDRITTAISRWHRDPEQPLYEQGADAVLAVLPPTDRAADEVDADTVANRAAQVITAMGDEIRELEHSRDRYRTAWLSARQRADRAAVLREAADQYAKLTDQNEAYDREQGELDADARLRHEVVRDVVAGLRRMADETATEPPQPSLRERHRAAWHALTPDQQTARLAELDEPAAGARQDGAQQP